MKILHLLFTVVHIIKSLSDKTDMKKSEMLMPYLMSDN